MRLSDHQSSIPVPYISKGMEAEKPCAARLFHTFHTFHTDGAHPCASGRARAPACVYTRVHSYFFSMEGMEGMEEGHRTRVLNVHTYAIPRQGVEGKEKA